MSQNFLAEESAYALGYRDGKNSLKSTHVSIRSVEILISDLQSGISLKKAVSDYRERLERVKSEFGK